jgi:hypothetical protein
MGKRKSKRKCVIEISDDGGETYRPCPNYIVNGGMICGSCGENALRNLKEIRRQQRKYNGLFAMTGGKK